MMRKINRAALLLLVLLLAPAFPVGAFALSDMQALHYAQLDEGTFEFSYIPHANSSYSVFLFSRDGEDVHACAEVFQDGELIASGEGSGEVCSAWLVKDVRYEIRVQGRGSAVIEIARNALSRSFSQPLEAKEDCDNVKMIAHGYDAHWYAFETGETGQMFLACAPEDPEMQMEALLFDDTGVLLGALEALPGGSCSLRYEMQENRSYRIRICAPGGGEGYYSLGVYRCGSGAPKLAFDAAEHVLAAGSELNLGAELGENAFLWISDAPEVAYVSREGMVYALQPGEAVITAYGAEDPASCRVIVEHIPLQGIDILGKQIALSAGDDTDIQIELIPENASDPRLRFQVENTKIASVTRDGVLKALQPGETTLNVFNADGTARDSIRVLVSPAVPRYRALLVGEQNYSFAEDTNRDGSENSVQAIASLLGTVKFENAAYSVRTARDLSRSELIAQIRSTFKNATDLDVSLLYITCHGSYSGGMSFLELSDGSSLSVRDLERELRRISGTVVVFIDCCNSGGSIGAASQRAAFAKGVTAAFAQGSLRASRYKVIASAGLDEDSFRIAFNEDAGAGVMATVFTRALCDGAGWNIDLDAPGTMGADRNYDGQITLGELQEYMKDRVNWYLDIASELTGENYRQSIQVYPEGDPLVLFAKES